MADNTNLIAGVASVTIDGTAYDLEGEFKYSIASVKRETLIGQNGVHGYKETPAAPYISGSFRVSGGLKTADFLNMTNVTFAGTLANGIDLIGRNMWIVGDSLVEVDTTEGKFEARWEGFGGSVTEN